MGKQNYENLSNESLVIAYGMVALIGRNLNNPTARIIEKIILSRMKKEEVLTTVEGIKGEPFTTTPQSRDDDPTDNPRLVHPNENPFARRWEQKSEGKVIAEGIAWIEDQLRPYEDDGAQPSG